MLGDIGHRLSGIISDVQIEMLDEAVAAMELFKYYDTMSQLSLYMEGAGQHEPILIQDMLFSIVSQGLDEILSNFEILTHGASIECKTIIVRGLFYMENAESSLHITDTIENAETSLDAFITLLEHYTGKPADYFFTYLSSSDNSFVTKLYELHKKRSDLLTENISKPNESAVERCRNFLARYPHTLLHDAIHIERYTPGVGTDILLSRYNEQLSNLYPHALKQLAIEIIGLMCLTNTLNKTFGADVKRKLAAIVPDPIEAARMVIDIDEITMELGLYAA